jgi:hypothetical protein
MGRLVDCPYIVMMDTMKIRIDAAEATVDIAQYRTSTWHLLDKLSPDVDSMYA